MDTSLDFARVMGPVMMIMGLSLALNRDAITKMARDYIKSPALVFLAGFLTLLLGMIIVAFHNVWVAGWPVLITLFGWVMIAAGIVRMNFAERLKKMGEGMLGSDAVMYGAAILYTVIGAILTWVSWLA